MSGSEWNKLRQHGADRAGRSGLFQAVRIIGQSKTTITRTIKAGRLSAIPRTDGFYENDPAELSRVHTPERRHSSGFWRIVSELQQISIGDTLKIGILRSHSFWSALTLLLLLDFTFIVATVIYYTSGADYDSFWRMMSIRGNFDYGYGEIWDNFKGLLTALFFTSCLLYQFKPAYLALSTSFALPVIDNILALHERTGGYLGEMLGKGGASFTAQVGELVAFACMGAIALAALITAYQRSDAETKKVVLIGIGIMAVLAGFAVGVDLLHSIANRFFGLYIISWAEAAFDLLEEGGEMMAISLGLAFSFAVFQSLVSSTVHSTSRPTHKSRASRAV